MFIYNIYTLLGFKYNCKTLKTYIESLPVLWVFYAMTSNTKSHTKPYWK